MLGGITLAVDILGIRLMGNWIGGSFLFSEMYLCGLHSLPDIAKLLLPVLMQEYFQKYSHCPLTWGHY